MCNKCNFLPYYPNIITYDTPPNTSLKFFKLLFTEIERDEQLKILYKTYIWHGHNFIQRKEIPHSQSSSSSILEGKTMISGH